MVNDKAWRQERQSEVVWPMLHPGVKRGEEVEETATEVKRKEGLLLKWGLQSGVQRGPSSHPRGQMCVGTHHPPHASIKLPYLISLPWAISKERPL